MAENVKAACAIALNDVWPQQAAKLNAGGLAFTVLDALTHCVEQRADEKLEGIGAQATSFGIAVLGGGYQVSVLVEVRKQRDGRE